MSRCCAVLILLLAAPTPMVAQWSARLPLGTRVRATTTHNPAFRVHGTMTELRGDTLWVQSQAGAVQGIALKDVRTLEVSTGQRAHTLEGLGIGLLGGAALGAVIGANAGQDDWLGPGVYALLGAGVGAGGGMLVGAILGSFVRTDTWQPAPGWELDVALSIAQPGLGLAIRF